MIDKDRPLLGTKQGRLYLTQGYVFVKYISFYILILHIVKGIIEVILVIIMIFSVGHFIVLNFQR